MEWKQICPDDPEAHYGPTAPSSGPRDIWGGSFSYASAFYVFGGAYAEFGQPRAQRDLGPMGVLSDLWR
jgi:hypothetical protein